MYSHNRCQAWHLSGLSRVVWSHQDRNWPQDDAAVPYGSCKVTLRCLMTVGTLCTRVSHLLFLTFTILPFVAVVSTCLSRSFLARSVHRAYLEANCFLSVLPWWSLTEWRILVWQIYCVIRWNSSCFPASNNVYGRPPPHHFFYLFLLRYNVCTAQGRVVTEDISCLTANRSPYNVLLVDTRLWSSSHTGIQVTGTQRFSAGTVYRKKGSTTECIKRRREMALLASNEHP